MAVPAPDEFVRLITERLGTDEPRELARRLNLADYDAPQRVRRWLHGRNGPNYEGTMRLLDAAGWLQMDDAAEPRARRTVGEIVRDRRRRHSLTVEQLAAYAARAADANDWEQRDWEAAIRRLEETGEHYADEREEHVIELAVIAAAKEHPEQARPQEPMKELAERLLPLLQGLIDALEADRGSDSG